MKRSQTSRRNFLATTTSITAASLLANSSLGSAMASPFVHTTSRTNAETIIGQGDHRYRVAHQWAQLPSQYTWQTTHNVAVDQANNLYVIHEGREDQKDHPSIFVFDPQGKFIRAFGNQFQVADTASKSAKKVTKSSFTSPPTKSKGDRQDDSPRQDRLATASSQREQEVRKRSVR